MQKKKNENDSKWPETAHGHSVARAIEVTEWHLAWRLLFVIVVGLTVPVLKSVDSNLF